MATPTVPPDATIVATAKMPTPPPQFAYLITGGVRSVEGIVVAIGIPVVARFRRIGGDEASDTRVVVAMAEQLQAAVAVCLVLPLAHETEGSGSGSCAADGHSEAVVEDAVGDRLAGVRYAACAAKGVAVVELQIPRENGFWHTFDDVRLSACSHFLRAKAAVSRSIPLSSGNSKVQYSCTTFVGNR
jgi:hypothetical protein